jgi:hypothetical protein
MKINDKALDLITEANNQEIIFNNCLKAGICSICGEELEAKFIKNGNILYTETTYIFNGLFSNRTKIETPICEDIVKITCPNQHKLLSLNNKDMSTPNTPDYGYYSNTINKAIQKELQKLNYYDSDDC